MWSEAVCSVCLHSPRAFYKLTRATLVIEHLDILILVLCILEEKVAFLGSLQMIQHCEMQLLGVQVSLGTNSIGAEAEYVYLLGYSED